MKRTMLNIKAMVIFKQFKKCMANIFKFKCKKNMFICNATELNLNRTSRNSLNVIGVY